MEDTRCYLKECKFSGMFDRSHQLKKHMHHHYNILYALTKCLKLYYCSQTQTKVCTAAGYWALLQQILSQFPGKRYSKITSSCVTLVI